MKFFDHGGKYSGESVPEEKMDCGRSAAMVL